MLDGANPASLGSAQILGGLQLDEVYAQTSTAGTTSILRDGANSTLVLSNSTATTTGIYSYSPYGESTASGSASTTLEFAGRENDGSTALYYYRARYYSPQLGRFISEDPIGLAGGLNTYAYAGGNPINRRDPRGESPIGAVIGGLLGGAYNVIANAGNIGEPGAASLGTLFVAGTIGGVAGGSIDNRAVAAGVSGALTSGITAYANG